MTSTLTYTVRSYATQKPFTISRGSKTSAEQIIVNIRDKQHAGIGACVPYPRYNESIQNVCEQINAVKNHIEDDLDIEALQGLMPAGAARNAIDCALWDLRAKRLGKPVYELVNLPAPTPHITAKTLTIASPEDIIEETKSLSDCPLLKLKLAGDRDDAARIMGATHAAPATKFILDANEALSSDKLNTLMATLQPNSLALIEQPVPAGSDKELAGSPFKSYLCADESFHSTNDIASIAEYYGAINIKLDKTGGFTEALSAARVAQQSGLSIMFGCMLGSSLAMAPAFMLQSFADYLDLDGPLLLNEDDDNGFQYEGTTMHPCRLWGMPA